MRKLALCLGVVFFVCYLLVLPTLAQQEQMVEVTSGRANVRSEDDPGADVIYVAERGELLEILRKSEKGWYRVKVPGEKIGWISQKVVLVVGTVEEHIQAIRGQILNLRSKEVALQVLNLEAAKLKLEEEKSRLDNLKLKTEMEVDMLRRDIGEIEKSIEGVGESIKKIEEIINSLKYN